MMDQNDTLQAGAQQSASSEGSSHLVAPSFAVSLDFFEGPLDLLLHLVRREEVTIEEVEMSKIAEQYLVVIRNAAELDLDIAAEFLVVAATLISIKSEALLPVEVSEEEEVEEGPEYYEELRRRLRQYQMVKERAQELRSLPQLGVSTFARKNKPLFEPHPEEFEIDQDSQVLGTMFVKLLRRIGATVDSIRVRLEPISVVDYMMRSISALQGLLPNVAPPKTFIGLAAIFRKQEDTPEHSAEQAINGTRGVMIGSFMSLLELVRRGVLGVEQTRDGGEIHLQMRLTEASSLDLGDIDETIEGEFGDELKEVNRG